LDKTLDCVIQGDAKQTPIELGERKWNPNQGRDVI